MAKTVYYCEACRFMFERVGEVDHCVDCGKPQIRHATEKEK